MKKNFCHGALALVSLVVLPALTGCGGSSSPPPINPTFTVGGSAAGLTANESATLLNNGGDVLSVSSNGTFTFSTGLAAGNSYDVTVQSAPPGVTCTISNGSGTIASSNVTSISLTCSTTANTVGGVVFGLGTGQSVTLLDNGADPLTVTSNGGFTFSTKLANLSSYDVTVQSGSTGASCSVSNGSNIVYANVTQVVVSCGADTETVLHSFGGGTDGTNPQAGLITDSAGNFYGTTSGGGAGSGGTVFKITATGTETVLYSFAGSTDGREPQANLVMDSAGNLYGTTYYGGISDEGTVFKVTPAGAETVLHSFVGGTDGMYPMAGLVMDSAGNLYGTTYEGGLQTAGTVFKISPGGTETILYSLPNGADPEAGLVMDSAGNIYGTTKTGGTSGRGSVFEISPSGTETLLYSFGGAADGAYPLAGLVMDSAGNLYGTTYEGGSNNQGTAFKISAAGTETVLYSFAGGTTDGANPQASLIMDSSGNLYGTTYNGGVYSEGVVFKISPTGTETVLYPFGFASPDGANPQAGLVMDSAGNLFGTTYSGGSYQFGTVFEIK